MEEQIDYPGSPNDVLSLRPLSTSRTEAGGRPSGYVEQGVHIGPLCAESGGAE